MNSHALELKPTNPGSNVLVVSEWQSPYALPMFQKIYVCHTIVREGFITGCRRLIGIDDYILKGLIKG